MDALKEIAGLANHLRHGNVTLWAIADDEYCAEMGLTVEEQGEPLSEFLHGVAERLDSEVRFTEGTSGKAIERADRYAEWLDDIEAELFGERIETFTHGDHERQSERMSDILSALWNGAERLMPKGMGWLFTEDGKPVTLGAELIADDVPGMACVDTIIFQRVGDGYEVEIENNRGFSQSYSPGQRVAVMEKSEKRELVASDADGNQIRIGDTVRCIANDDELESMGIYGFTKGIKAELEGKLTVTGMTKDERGTSWAFFSETTLAIRTEFLRADKRVLDADGVKIELGDDLYSVEGSLKFHVGHIDRVNGKIATGAMFAIDKWADPSLYTHRAPVLAADGKPLREGETVWGTDGGFYRVTSVHDGEVFARHVGGLFGAEVESAGGEGLYRLRADQLTHERPDSWERLEKDANKAVCLYFGVNTKACSECAHNSWECSFDKDHDLVRRAKALAERGQ